MTGRPRSRPATYVTFATAIALLVMTPALANEDRIATQPNPDAPSFSRSVASAFPDQSFTTCHQGQFQDVDVDYDLDGIEFTNERPAELEAEIGPRQISDPHHWFLRTTQDGHLHIDVGAVGWWGAEEDFLGGHVLVQLFDGTTSVIGPVAVPHDPGPFQGTFVNTVSLPPVTVGAGDVLRLEVRVDWEPHYQLGFVLLDAEGDLVPDGVEVGVNSPALPEWLEGGPQVFHVNVDDGEELHLRLTPEPLNPEHHDDFASSVAVYADPGLSELLATADGTDEAYDVVVDAPAGGGTLTVWVEAHHHYMLEKLSGDDTGIYFDACPVESDEHGDHVCVPLLAGRTIDVGDVCVSDDGEYLSVSYHTVEGWRLAETHLAVSGDTPGFGEWTDPANRWQNVSGNPAPGRFPHHGTPDPGEQHVTHAILLAEIGGDGDVLHLGAHAVVHDGSGATETAWAAGDRFVERGSWATWFTYGHVPEG